MSEHNSSYYFSTNQDESNDSSSTSTKEDNGIRKRSEFTILLVEDENLVALDVRRKLERAGYTIVGIVMTGAEAVQAAVATEPAET